MTRSGVTRSKPPALDDVDPATVEALMDMGVDAIITNYPNHVRQIMADRGMRLPKAYLPH